MSEFDEVRGDMGRFAAGMMDMSDDVLRCVAEVAIAAEDAHRALTEAGLDARIAVGVVVGSALEGLLP